MTRLENNTKAEKPKQLRRKTVADSFIAPLLDSKNVQHPANKGMKHCDFIFYIHVLLWKHKGQKHFWRLTSVTFHAQLQI